MAFSYSAGTATPGYGGLAEFTSLRINDGSFRPIAVPPLTQTPPMRFKADPVPRGGGVVSLSGVDPWQFDIQAFFDVSSPDDVQGAIDYLKGKLNPDSGPLTLTLNAKGWSATRQMTVRLAGQIAVEDPTVERKKLTRRSLTIPLIAEDPIQYATTQTTTAITSSSTVTNAGNASVSYIVRFDGANTSFIQVADALGHKVRLDYAIPSGKYVEISTKDGLIITDTGVTDLYQYLTIDSELRFLPAAGLNLTKTSGSGGTASVKHYSGWY